MINIDSQSVMVNLAVPIVGRLTLNGGVLNGRHFVIEGSEGMCVNSSEFWF